MPADFLGPCAARPEDDVLVPVAQRHAVNCSRQGIGLVGGAVQGAEIEDQAVAGLDVPGEKPVPMPLDVLDLVVAAQVAIERGVLAEGLRRVQLAPSVRASEKRQAFVPGRRLEREPRLALAAAVEV